MGKFGNFFPNAKISPNPVTLFDRIIKDQYLTDSKQRQQADA
jgi:hypothetical protein